MSTLGNTRNLIVGAAGFIGSALSERLRIEGQHVTELRRSQQLNGRGQFDNVFYCAGMTADYLDRPMDTVFAHVGLLSEILQSHDIGRFIYYSSTRLYDCLDPATVALEDADFLVNPANPRHLFDLTKLAAESLCQNVSIRTHSIRLSSVYSESYAGDGFMGRVLKAVAEAQQGDEVHVDSSPNISRDYVHINDVIEASLIISDRGTHKIYNVASGFNLSNAQFAEIIKRRTGRSLHFAHSTEAISGATISISRLESEFDFRPRRLEVALGDWMDKIST